MQDQGAKISWIVMLHLKCLLSTHPVLPCLLLSFSRVRLIVKERDYNRALLLLQQESGRRNVRHGYNLQFVRDVMQSIPHCVSLIHENERLKKRKKAADLSYFTKEAMR